jgi:DNA-nicking Smr family endonuclease
MGNFCGKAVKDDSGNMEKKPGAVPAAAEGTAKKDENFAAVAPTAAATPAPAPAADTTATTTPAAAPVTVVAVEEGKKEPHHGHHEEKKADEHKEHHPHHDGDHKEHKSLEESTAETEVLYQKYRAEADEHARNRGRLFEESKAAFESGEKARAKELSDQAKEEGRLMEQASLNGARHIFKAKNKSQPHGTIDLHGLHVKEAELIVSEQLDEHKKAHAKELKIIIGAGHHSDADGPKVGPAIKKLLEGKEYKWAMDETNTSGGALIVTF